MKIIYIYQYFGTPAGSWSTRVYEFTKRWVKAGHEVTVITSPYDKSDITASKFVDYQNIDGINLIVINSGDSNRFSKVKRVYRSIIFSIVSTWFAITKKAEVIVASSGPITVGIPGLFAKILSKKYLIFEVRDLWPAGGIEMGIINNPLLQKLFLAFERTLYSKSNKIVVLSDGQQSHIQELNKTWSSKTEIVYNSSDTQLFMRKGVKNVWERPFVLYAGSLGFIHNVEYLVKAVKFLEKITNEVDVLIIGGGNERNELEELSIDLGLNNIYFLGQKTKSEIVSYMQQCIATLFTTLDNPVQDTCSPNKIFDSFAAGKPIIQTTKGWIKDLVDDEHCGINCDISKPETMAKAIYNYFVDKDLLITHKINSQRLGESKFNRDRLSKRYLELIEETVG